MNKIYCLYVLDHEIEGEFMFDSVHISEKSAINFYNEMVKMRVYSTDSEYKIEETEIFDYE